MRSLKFDGLNNNYTDLYITFILMINSKVEKCEANNIKNNLPIARLKSKLVHPKMLWSPEMLKNL